MKKIPRLPAGNKKRTAVSVSCGLALLHFRTALRLAATDDGLCHVAAALEPLLPPLESLVDSLGISSASRLANKVVG